MQTKHARLIFVLAIFLLSLVVVDFVRISTNKTPTKTTKSKTDLVAKVNEIGQVLNSEVGATTYYYKFYLKDQTGVALSSTSNSNTSLIKGATITVTNKSSFSCGDTGSNYAFSEADGLYKLICNEAQTLNIKISKSGYSTKYTSLTYYQGEIPTIYLSRYVAPTPASATPETIKDVKLPESFSETGGSTNLTTVADTSKIENLTLDTHSGTIKFNEAVDLSATTTKDKFKELDKYVKVEQIGVVGIDSTNLPALNKKATITMKSLNFVKTPRILVDGKPNTGVISNIRYKDGVLTFDVTHFSTFTAVPTVGINEPADNFETKEKNVVVKGTVSDPAASVSAKLNNKNLGKVKVATNGAFQKEVELEEGLNRLVISALSANLATASASVSGHLLKDVNSLTTPLSILLAILGIIGIAILIWAFKHLKRNMNQKVNASKPPIVS